VIEWIGKLIVMMLAYGIFIFIVMMSINLYKIYSTCDGTIVRTPFGVECLEK